MSHTIYVLLHTDKIRIWTIQWSRIAPFTTNVICGPVIDVVIRVYNKPSCVLPSVPAAIGNGSPKYEACLVNAYKIWPRFFSRENCTQEIDDVCWGFWSWEFGPSNNNPTWCTDCLNTVESACLKVVGSLRLCWGNLIMWSSWCTSWWKPGKSLIFRSTYKAVESKIGLASIANDMLVPLLLVLSELASLCSLHLNVGAVADSATWPMFKLMLTTKYTTPSICQIIGAIFKCTMLVFISTKLPT